MSAESSLKHQRLRDRALFLQKARSFFIQKGVLEVDTPILSKTAPIDEHIDIMTVSLAEEGIGYLHSSPEYAMKRLLCEGIGDIFQLSHVFRLGEHGSLHNPEFTMVEWYRVGMDFSSFIQETLEFIELFLGEKKHRYLTYKQAFIEYLAVDPMRASAKDLLTIAKDRGLEPSLAIGEEKDTLLHLLMGFLIEPNLGKEEYTILIDYPASQAALAAIEEKEGEYIAKRFEIYYQGIELGNGYLELTDPDQQKKRLEESNQKRMDKGKAYLPLDFRFIEALRKGMPSSCGVAVGFDRLLQLRHKALQLQEILPFGWQNI